jgi:hypothetical protein
MKKSPNKILALVALAILPAAFLLAVVGPTSTASAQTRTDVCEGVSFTGASCDPTSCDIDPNASGCASGQLATTVTNIVNVFSVFVGIASVIMIMFGGFRYITAGGDSGKINSAQQTIIYALVGLVVVGFAQVIVRFVIAVTS